MPEGMTRDYTLLRVLQDLEDDTLVGAHEVAALLDLSPITIRHHRITWLPKPIDGCRRQRWRLGSIREAIRIRSCSPPFETVNN